MALPEPFLSRSGEEVIALAGGSGIRVNSWLEGSTAALAETYDHAFALGSFIGGFHRGLKSRPETGCWPNTSVHRSIEIFSNLEKQTKVVGSDDELSKVADQILRTSKRLPFGLMPQGSEIVAHGDLRLENIVFSGSTRIPIGLIDLDTLGRSPIDDELGDLFRSIWDKASQSSLTLEQRTRILTGVLDGYISNSDLDEAGLAECVVIASLRITLELAARFCLAGIGGGDFLMPESRIAARRDCCAKFGIRALSSFQEQIELFDHSMRWARAWDRLS